VAGGHVESGEKLYEALVRELREETQWELDEVMGLATAFDWADGDRILREYDFVVTVKGNFEAVLEEGKAIEGMWVGKDETAAVAEHGNDKMLAIFEAGFSLIDSLQPALPTHVGRVMGPDVAGSARRVIEKGSGQKSVHESS
jgi:8-oxo-dGTP pyrophosphatase MutT (NUDIX family)